MNFIWRGFKAKATRHVLRAQIPLAKYRQRSDQGHHGIDLPK